MGMFTYFLEQLRGARHWPTTEASIVSCTWSPDTGKARRGGGTGGSYEVTFSYEVEGEYYGGRFSIVGGEHSDTPYSAGKKIIVGSNPHHPEQNYPQGIADQQALAFKILFAVMICLFALIIFVNLIGKK